MKTIFNSSKLSISFWTHIWTVTLTGLFFITVFSCDEDEKEDEDVTSQEIIIAKGVNVISSQVWNKQILSVDPSNYTIRFSNDISSVQQIKVGDIIISDVGEGLLRKVKNINTVNDELVVETEFASLSEAIDQGTINVKFSLTDSQIKGIAYHVDGVKLVNDLTKGSSQTTYNWDINTVLYDFDGRQSTTADQIKLMGKFSCDFKIPLYIDYGVIKGLKEFKFGIESKENLNLRLFTGLEYSIEKEVNLATVFFTPITIMVGIVPVVFTPELEVIAGVGGSADASITSEINQSLSFDAGIKFIKEQGWAPYSTFTKNLGYQPPQLNLNANAEAYIKPELSLKVYGVAGPYANLKLYGKLYADIMQNPWWKLYGGIKMSAGAKASILDLFVLDFSLSDLIKYEQVLAQATTPLVSVPKVTTGTATATSPTSATSGGDVTANGGATVTARGVCWSTSQNPTTASSHTTDGTGTGSFTSSITGLTANTTYYVRAYATNSAGTAYGSQINFTTINNLCVPDLISPASNATLDNSCTNGSDNITWSFDWSNCEGATSYNLYVIYPGAANPIIDVIVSSSDYQHISTGYVSDANLSGWTWRVRAMINGEWGNWSNDGIFNVEPVNSDCIPQGTSGDINDNTGDARENGPDLSYASISVNDVNMKLQVVFQQGTFNQLTTCAMFSLDTDNDPATGHPGIDAGGNDAGLIGTEYLVEFFHTTNGLEVRVWQYAGTPNSFTIIGNAIPTYINNGYEVTIPLRLITINNGILNFKVTACTQLSENSFTGVLDYMTDLGQPVGQVR